MSSPAPVPFENLWDSKAVMAYLKCGKSTVYQWAEAGTLPSMRIGGLLRFDPEVVRRWARGELPPAKVTPIRPPRGSK